METEKRKVCEEVSVETSTKKEKKVWYKNPWFYVKVAAASAVGYWAFSSYKKTGSVKGAGKLMGNQVTGVAKKVTGMGKKEEPTRPQQNQNRQQENGGRTYERPQYRGGNGERKQQNV